LEEKATTVLKGVSFDFVDVFFNAGCGDLFVITGLSQSSWIIFVKTGIEYADFNRICVKLHLGLSQTTRRS
jgi:hypothetical protein